ncbi:MAG: helix-turn-helix domain-containing protein [Bacteroidota bacterium]
MNSPLPEIMTPVAVMELLDVCRTTLSRMQTRGDFPYYKFGKRVYFRRSEIIEAMIANRVEVKPIQVKAEDVKQAA